jgi:hypothetical protein
VRSCARLGEVVGKDGMNVGGELQVSFVSTARFPLFAVMWQRRREAVCQCVGKASGKRCAEGCGEGSCTRCGRRCEGRNVAMYQNGGVMRYEWEWRKEKTG